MKAKQLISNLRRENSKFFFLFTGTDGTGLLIANEVDITRMDNTELIMRINTDMKTEDTFYTDLNGFQMIKRKKYQKLPLQANYYPIPSMAYMQDETSRLTLISRTPLGGSSLKSGQLEIMMDRRLMQDDNRGLFQGVTDNRVTLHEFALLLERKTKGCVDEVEVSCFGAKIQIALFFNILALGRKFRLYSKYLDLALARKFK